MLAGSVPSRYEYVASLNFERKSDLQSVLIGAGAQDSLLSLQELPPLYNVRKDHSRQVADMGCYSEVNSALGSEQLGPGGRNTGVDVEDRCSDIVRFCVWSRKCGCETAAANGA